MAGRAGETPHPHYGKRGLRTMSIYQKRKAKGSCHTGLNTYREIGERQLPLRPSPCPTQPLFTHFPHQCGTCTSQRVLPTPPTGLLMPGGAEAAYLVPVGDLAGASPVPHSLSLHPLGLTADEPLGSPVVKLYSSLPKELMWPHSSFRENLPPPPPHRTPRARTVMSHLSGSKVKNRILVSTSSFGWTSSWMVSWAPGPPTASGEESASQNGGEAARKEQATQPRLFHSPA